MHTIRDTTIAPRFKEEVSRFLLADGDRYSRYGIGCAWLGRNGLAPAALAQDVAVLEEAFAKGVRYFDTSSAYGESEVVVGEFLHALGAAKRRDVFVASKTLIPEPFDAESACRHVEDQLEASLRRLRSETVDLYQIHDVKKLDQVLAPGGAIEALLEAKRDGRVRYVGLATRYLDVLEEAALDGRFDTLLTYSDYTPLDQSAEGLIGMACDRGIGIINGSPLSAGILRGPDPITIPVPLWHEESVRRRELALELYSLCRENGVSILNVALHFPLRQGGIDMNLTGPADGKELASTLEALRDPVPDALWDLVEEWIRKRGTLGDAPSIKQGQG